MAYINKSKIARETGVARSTVAAKWGDMCKDVITLTNENVQEWFNNNVRKFKTKKTESVDKKNSERFKRKKKSPQIDIGDGYPLTLDYDEA